MSVKFLRRYTNLPALIYLLKKQKISLLDPNAWDDSNDSHFLLVYKSRKGLKTLLAICFTQVPETYHHWRVFAAGSSGICVKFKRAELLKSFEKCSGIKTDAIKYRKLKELEKQKPEIDQLPFIKRSAFEDEREFRVIYESAETDLSQKDISIPLSCIENITLSPWAYKNFTKYIKEVIRGINDCENIKIVASSILSNDKWKRIGGFIRSKR